MRKRMSVVRRAHPDVSNEVAFVALAQSRGRASEAAAVLHLPRAKDEAVLVTMMLDVAAFVALAREMAERWRRSRQLEKHCRTAAARDPPHPGQKEERSRPSTRQDLDQREQRDQRDQQDQQDQQDHGHEQEQPPPRSGADPSSQSKGEVAHRARNRHHHHRSQHLHSLAESNGGSRGELQSRRSDSAPSLLPPIERRLVEGTPPSPCSLRAVLSTSRSVAVEVPRGFGLALEADLAPNGDARSRAPDPKTSRRHAIHPNSLHYLMHTYMRRRSLRSST